MGIGAQGGTIKVVIDVKGQGDGAAVVDKTAKAVKGLASEAGGLKGIGENLKGATSGITSLGGGLAGLRMGMLGIPTAIGGMVAGLVAFASAVKDAFVRDPIKEFHDHFARDFSAMEQSAQKLIDRLNTVKGTLKEASTEELSALGGLQEIKREADLLLGPLREQEGILARQSKSWLEQGDVMAGFAMIQSGIVEGVGKHRGIQDDILKLEIKREKAQASIDRLMAAQNAKHATQFALEAAAQQQRSKQSIMTKVQADTAAPLAMLDALGLKYDKTKPVAGGGARTPEREPDNAMEVISDRARQIISDAKQEITDREAGRQAGIKRRETRDLKDFRAANDNAADEQGIADFESDKRAQGVRDFSAALLEGVPALDQYAGALGKMTDVWAEYAKTSTGLAGAVTSSIGAIAKAGAQQIKDERARAGVLAAIELGLGFATAFVNPPESAGHFVAAGILGVVAATGIGTGGGAKGGSGSAATPRQSLIRESGGGQSNGPIVLNIGFLAGGSPQENAESIGRILDRRRAA